MKSVGNLSGKLAERPLFNTRKKSFDKDAQAVIDKAVRKLVMSMRAFELKGVMSREDIEECVLNSMENAEYLYYGLAEHELMQIIDMEINNDKRRKEYSTSI